MRHPNCCAYLAANLNSRRMWSLAWLIAAPLALTLCASSAMANPTFVNCDAGQSLNSAISKLDKQVPNLVLVQGTCTNYVEIAGFENLTIRANPSATVVQPNK